MTHSLHVPAYLDGPFSPTDDRAVGDNISLIQRRFRGHQTIPVLTHSASSDSFPGTICGLRFGNAARSISTSISATRLRGRRIFTTSCCVYSDAGDNASVVPFNFV